jgi:hypothetical protein
MILTSLSLEMETSWNVKPASHFLIAGLTFRGCEATGDWQYEQEHQRARWTHTARRSDFGDRPSLQEEV